MIYENKVDEFFVVSSADYSFSYPLHVHEYIEVVRVIDGTLQMQIGAHVYTLSTGDYAIIFPNVVHDYNTLSDDAHSNLNISNCVLALMPLYKMKLEQNYPLSPVIRHAQIPDMVNNIETELHRLTSDFSKPDINLIGALFSALLGYCIPLLELTPVSSNMNRELSLRIISYVAQHSLEDLTQDTIAKQFGLSKFALSRIFSSMLKTNFRTYINSQRVNYAIYLLQNTEQDITDICYAAGFQSQQTFNRAFREQTKMSPSQYRRRHTGLLYPENQMPLLPTPLAFDKK